MKKLLILAAIIGIFTIQARNPQPDMQKLMQLDTIMKQIYSSQYTTLTFLKMIANLQSKYHILKKSDNAVVQLNANRSWNKLEKVFNSVAYTNKISNGIEPTVPYRTLSLNIPSNEVSIDSQQT